MCPSANQSPSVLTVAIWLPTRFSVPRARCCFFGHGLGSMLENRRQRLATVIVEPYALGHSGAHNSARPHSSLGPGTPDPRSPKVELQPQRHCIPKDCQVVAAFILGGPHHDTAWRNSLHDSDCSEMVRIHFLRTTGLRLSLNKDAPELRPGSHPWRPVPTETKTVNR